jgi:hypothetical protein
MNPPFHESTQRIPQQMLTSRLTVVECSPWCEDINAQFMQLRKPGGVIGTGVPLVQGNMARGVLKTRARPTLNRPKTEIGPFARGRLHAHTMVWGLVCHHRPSSNVLMSILLER